METYERVDVAGFCNETYFLQTDNQNESGTVDYWLSVRRWPFNASFGR